MDLSQTIAPKSDQLDAVELLEPTVFTVEKVTPGNAEQPVNIYLEGQERPWRPSKGMRRVLVAIWGADGTKYAGQSLELFNEPNVMFAGQKVGGIRISKMTGIDKPRIVPALVSRGKTSSFTIQPLQAAPKQATVTDSMIDKAVSVDDLRALWEPATPAQRKRIQARVDALQAGAE